MCCLGKKLRKYRKIRNCVIYQKNNVRLLKKVGLNLISMKNKYVLQKILLYNLQKNCLFHPRVHKPIRFKGAGSAERSKIVKVAFSEKYFAFNF